MKAQSLDPTRTGSWFLVEYGIAELPLRLDENYQLQPWLLESYAAVDERRWRLKLRPNLRFQNGKPLTAAALAAAMNRQLKLSPAARGVLPAATIGAIGEREVTLETAAPDPNVPAALADELVFPVYDVEAVESAGGDAGKLIESNCYTGPYRAVALDDRRLQLARNENYWRGPPPLESVSVAFIKDAQARLFAVEHDEADLALFPPAEAKRTLSKSERAFFVTSRRSTGGPRIFFNLRRPPFDRLAVRRAFSLGVDYRSLATEVMDDVFETANGFYPPSLPWAVANQRTDAAEAARLLDEVGWLRGADELRYKNGEPLEAVLLVYPQQPDFATLATAIQAQLRAIGFSIAIRQVESIEEAMKDKTSWDAGIISPGIMTTGGAPDPFLREYLTTDARRNFGGVADAELDELIGELSRTFESTRRDELLRVIQRLIIAERAYEVRPVFSRARVVVGRRYRGYRPSPQLHHVTNETAPTNDG